MRGGEITQETIKNEEILLDGAKIVDSTLEDCILIFRGYEPFTLHRNTLTRCGLRFDGPAALTVAVLRKLQEGGFPTGITFND